jgi:hypothetical protein
MKPYDQVFLYNDMYGVFEIEQVVEEVRTCTLSLKYSGVEYFYQNRIHGCQAGDLNLGPVFLSSVMIYQYLNCSAWGAEIKQVY